MRDIQEDPRMSCYSFSGWETQIQVPPLVWGFEPTLPTWTPWVTGATFTYLGQSKPQHHWEVQTPDLNLGNYTILSLTVPSFSTSAICPSLNKRRVTFLIRSNQTGIWINPFFYVFPAECSSNACVLEPSDPVTGTRQASPTSLAEDQSRNQIMIQNMAIWVNYPEGVNLFTCQLLSSKLMVCLDPRSHSCGCPSTSPRCWGVVPSWPPHCFSQLTGSEARLTWRD